MAEPVFKLLRCDAEASHMLGWAKKQVKRIVEHAKIDSFQRTWGFGDVTVKASYFAGVARLWLEAAGTERMAVWATLPNPVPYRGVTVGVEAGDVWPDVGVYGADGQITALGNESLVYTAGIAVVGPSRHPFEYMGWGSKAADYEARLSATYNVTGTNEYDIRVLATFVSPAPYETAGPPAGWMGYYGYGDGPSGIPQYVYEAVSAVTANVLWHVTVDGAPVAASATAAAKAAFDAADAASKASVGGSKTKVVASDGTVIAEAIVDVVKGNSGAEFTVTNLPAALVWSGGSSMLLYSFPYGYSTITPEITAPLAYVVPDDCVYLLDGRTLAGPPECWSGSDVRPAYTTGGGRAAFSNVAGTRVGPLYTVGFGKAYVGGFNSGGWIYGGSPGAHGQILPEHKAEAKAYYVANGDSPLAAPWLDAWCTGLEEGVERRKSWFKKNSDDVLAALRAGEFELPDAWDYAIKTNAPASTGTYRPFHMLIVYNSSVVSDTSAAGTQAGVKIERRTVTMSYELPVEGGTEHREESVIGTKTTTTVRHNDSSGQQRMLSSSAAFDNWYEPLTAPFGMDHKLFNMFLPDVSGVEKRLFWTGTVQTSGGYHADSAFAAPSQYDFVRAKYTPPQPAYSNTLRGEWPPFMLEYHSLAKPRYKKGEGVLFGNSSRLMPGMSVSIVLIERVCVVEEAARPLGAFTHLDDLSGNTKIAVYGAAKYLYDYDSGSFSFAAWVPLKDEFGAEIEKREIEIPPDYDLEPECNALLIYGGIKWDDVKETARAQRKALSDPNDPAHDPLMKAVLDALKPPEPAP